MTLGEFFWGYVGTGVVPRAWSSPWHTWKHCGTGASMFGNIRYNCGDITRGPRDTLWEQGNRFVLKAPGQVIMGILGVRRCWGLKVPLELTLSNLPSARTRPHHSKFHSPWRSWTSPKREILSLLWAGCPREVMKHLRAPWLISACCLHTFCCALPTRPSLLHPWRVKTEAAPQAKQPQLSHPVSTGKVLQPSYHLGGPKVILAYNLLLMPSFIPENHEGRHWLGLINYLSVSTHCQPPSSHGKSRALQDLCVLFAVN